MRRAWNAGICRPVIDRFMEKIDRSGECWLWTAGKFHDGYAAFKGEDGRQRRAHRWAYEHFVGPIPEGMLIMHACDVKHCVNPEHLGVGTVLDNAQDMTRKGRGRLGLKHGMVKYPPKLNRALADEIRERYAAGGITHQELADEYKVCRQMIGRIINGLTWAW